MGPTTEIIMGRQNHERDRERGGVLKIFQVTAYAPTDHADGVLK